MPPSNSSFLQKLKASCFNPTSSNCVEWDGLDLPIIEICKGDSISDIQYKVAEVIQKIKTDSDLTDLDLACLLSDCTSCPQPEKTLKNVIRMLLEKVCTIEELLGSVGETPEVLLPMIPLSCLSYKTSEGDTISEALLDSAVKVVIQKVCIHEDKINLHDSTLVNHETRIVELEQTTNNLDIPQVTSDCLFSGQRDIDIAFNALDTDYCNYKAVLGSASEFQQSFSKICKDLDKDFGTLDGWIKAPTNLSQFYSNTNIMVCQLNSLVKFIQKNCCPTGCDSVTIGFVTEFDKDNVILKFTTSAGTFIPEGFEDCGTTLTIANEDGVSTTVAIEIVEGGETEEIDVSSFAIGDLLTFTLDVKMCAEGLTCEKCVSKIVKYTSGCCLITNIDSEDVVIVYSTKVTTAS